MRVFLSRQLFKSNLFMIQKPCHSLFEKHRVVTVIEPETNLIEIRWQVLGADLVIRTNQAALQKAPHVFDGIDMRVPRCNLFGFVDFLVLHRAANGIVSGQCVSDDHFDVLSKIRLNEFRQRFFVQLGHGFKANLTAAFNHSGNRRLARRAAPALPRLASPDIRFIGFNDAIERAVVWLHGMADSVTEMPRRLVGHAKRAFHLIGGHAFLRFAHEINGQKPFPKRQMRIVKYAAGCHRKLVATGIAIVLVALRDCRNALGIAARAAHAVNPAQFYKVGAAGVFTVKLLNELN